MFRPGPPIVLIRRHQTSLPLQRLARRRRHPSGDAYPVAGSRRDDLVVNLRVYVIASFGDGFPRGMQSPLLQYDTATLPKILRVAVRRYPSFFNRLLSV